MKCGFIRVFVLFVFFLLVVPSGFAVPNVLSVPAQNSHALDAIGNLYSCGSNQFGLNLKASTGFSDSTTTNTFYKTPLTGVRYIDSKVFRSIAVMRDGTARWWGADSSYVSHHVPATIPGITGVIDVAVSYDKGAVLLKDNGDQTAAAYHWNFDPNVSPTPITGLERVITVAAGNSHFVAVTSSGKVYTWGMNTFGQLGDGTNVSNDTPREVPGLVAKYIGAGEYNSFAIMPDGSVKAWGKNTYGALGDGTTTNQYSPVNVVGMTDVKRVMGGNTNTFALKNDGTVWMWGWHNYIDGFHYTTTESTSVGNMTNSTPVKAPDVSNIVYLAVNSKNVKMMDSNGKVTGWGNNITYHQCTGDDINETHQPIAAVYDTAPVTVIPQDTTTEPAPEPDTTGDDDISNSCDDVDGDKGHGNNDSGSDCDNAGNSKGLPRHVLEKRKRARENKRWLDAVRSHLKRKQRRRNHKRRHHRRKHRRHRHHD
jgi:alpha-tubulin suppressor-like RCC1 family protein